MKATFSVLIAAALVIAAASVMAAPNPPTPGSAPRITSPAPTVPGPGLDEILRGPIVNKTIVACDQYGIVYTLNASGGRISGTALGASSCGYTGEFTVSGTYTRAGHVNFTVTNPQLCDLQFYIFDGDGSKACKCANGTYDWNGDGVDGAMNLVLCP